MHTILMIDDDLQYMSLVKEYLSRHDYLVYCADSYLHADTFLNNSLDCILLDIRLADHESGYEICQKIKRSVSVPIIFLSNYSADDDRIQGFLSGADDFIAKPCNLEELNMRIMKRIHPTIGQKQKDQIQSGDLFIDALRHKAFFQDKGIPLTEAEFNILYFLAIHERNTYSQFEIFEEVWKEPIINNAHTVQVHISSLRKKLNNISVSHEYIQTIWGKGYQFVGVKNE